MSPVRSGDGCSLSEFFKMEEDLEAPNTNRSFEERVTPPTTAELSDFDKTGLFRSYKHASDTLRGNATDGPTVARFALSGIHPPKLTDAILLAERVHAAQLRLFDAPFPFIATIPNQ